MTVQKDVTKNIYVGNGSTRTFPFTFECPAEHPEYIKVYLMQDDGTALATSDYQLDMDAKQITYPSSGIALPEGKKLVIMRELPLQQMMNLVNNGPYFAEDIETAFDECVMAMQQIAEKLNRSIIMSVDIDGDTFVNEVPFEAGKSFRIADDGKSIVLTEDPAKVLPLAQGVYAQAQAQAQSASASAAAAAKSEDSAFESAVSAAENAELTSGYKQEALTAKAAAATSATNAKASEANAKTSENNAEASKEAAQSAASNANNFATSASSSASEAKSYRDAANNYAANAKNYSENVNVFTPSVSSSGVLSWTNKAGLANPPAVNIKGEKGDQGLQGVQGVKGDTGAKGDRGATGDAATVRIGTVTTGAPGSEAIVTNVGTVNDAVFNFTLPRGEKGADGGIDIDTVLSDTSTNPVQNKTIKNEFDSLLLPDGMLTIPSSVASYISKVASDSLTLINDLTQTVIEQSADGNTWETLFDSDTANKTVKTLYKNGLNLSPFIGVAKGKMVRVTLSTHTTVYFASIALGMKIMDESNPSAANSYKCYAGMNSLMADPVATGTIATWGSTPCTVFRNLSNNTVRYVFNEDKKDLTIFFSGIYCKGSAANRIPLRYDSDNKRTVTDFPIAAPSFLGTATKATQDGDGKVISTTYAKVSEENKWSEQQYFKVVKLVYEKYISSNISGTVHAPSTSVIHYVATGAFTLNLTNISNNLKARESSVFTAYIESSADYPLTISNAGTIKYIGSASDVAITSAGLLLNILMIKDASDTVTSIVQASKLEGAS